MKQYLVERRTARCLSFCHSRQTSISFWFTKYKYSSSLDISMRRNLIKSGNRKRRDHIFCTILLSARVAAVATFLVITNQGFADEFPKIPVRSYQAVPALPASDAFILEVRDTSTIMQPEIGIFDLDSDKEMVWQLPNSVLVPEDALYGADWAPATRELVILHMGALQVIESDGTYKEVALKTFGMFASNPRTRYADVKRLAVSPDGKIISYSLYIRDEHDKLFTDLMVQELIPGALPRSLASPSFDYVSAWSPDGKALAFNTKEGQIAVKDLEGKTHLLVDVPGRVFEIRWSPDGKKIGLSLDQRFWSLDVMTGALHRTVFDKGDKADVREFAWSPDGTSVAFRSSFESGKECNTSLGYYYETGSMPCRNTFYLYIAELDGQKTLKRISKVREMRPGPLFWVPAVVRAGSNQRSVIPVVALPPALLPGQSSGGTLQRFGTNATGASSIAPLTPTSTAPASLPAAAATIPTLQTPAIRAAPARAAPALVSVDGKIYNGVGDCISQQLNDWMTAQRSPPSDADRATQVAVIYRHCKSDAVRIPVAPQAAGAPQPGDSRGRENSASSNPNSVAAGSSASEKKLAVPAASGTIYRCTTANGQVTFSGTSCGPDAALVNATPASTPAQTGGRAHP